MNTATNTLNHRLDRKVELEQRRKALAAERGRAAGELSNIRNFRLPDARSTVEGWQRAIQNENGRRSTHQAYQDELRAAKADLEGVVARERELDSRVRALTEELDGIEAALHACDSDTTVEDVLAHQHALHDAARNVDKLRAAVTEREKALAATDDDMEARLEALQIQREGALADVSIGRKTSADVKAIDERIDALLKDSEPQQHDAIAKFRDLRQTINGLRRRLEEAEQGHARLRSQSREVMAQFLVTEARTAYAAYLKQAAALLPNIRRLVALQAIHRRYADSRSRFLRPEASTWIRALLPLFDLDCESGVDAHDAEAGILFSSQLAVDIKTDGRNEFENQEDIEMARFREAGLSGLL